MENNNTNNKPKYQKNENEIGCAFSKSNDKGAEYLSIKLTIDGEDIYLKGFLNGGWSEESNRPKWLIFKSNSIPNPTSKETFG